MTTNCLVEDFLKAELTDFLKLHGYLTYDDCNPRTRWCILMTSKLTVEMFHILATLIVKDWMEKGVTKMIELESKQGYNLEEVVSIVGEQVRDYLVILGV
ncbi:hypothetical protein BGX38DRAFT_1276365 [Terfezia claveryi]|nr:hypothetical protein BGX38DRAFT_1276365 [Terfezia claveryi]